MKKFILLVSAILACSVASSWAAISVGATGSITYTFDSLPPASEWSTAVLAGNNATYTDSGSLDGAVVNTSAATIAGAIQDGTGGTSNNGARRNTSTLTLYTRTTSISVTLLMATLQNDTGAAQNGLRIVYDLSGTTTGEDPGCEGHRVFFSLTGAAGSWTPIPELTGDTLGAKDFTVSIGNWAPGASLYLVWADDNGVPGSDGAYEIDNITFTATKAKTMNLTSPTEGSSFAEGLPIQITGNADSDATNITVYVDNDLTDGLPGTSVFSTTNLTFAYSLTGKVIQAQPYGVYAIAQYADGSTFASSTNSFSVVANAAPFIVIRNPQAGATNMLGVPITVDFATLDSEGAVSNVTVYFNGVAVGSTNFPAESVSVFVSGRATSLGDLVITAVATDELGLTATGQVTVVVDPNLAPVISTNLSLVTGIDASTNVITGTEITVLAGTAVTNFIRVADADGSIARVVFYRNNVPIFTNAATVGNASPGGVAGTYGYIFNDTPAGTHTVTALAYDNGLNIVTSRTVTITATNDPAFTYIITNQSAWKYFDTTNYPDATWINVNFDDSGWSNGVADFGYGNVSGGNYDNIHPQTTLINGASVSPRPPSVLYRKHFNIADRNAFTNLVVKLLRDDAAQVYINGTLVYTNNIAGDALLTAYAAGNPDDGTVYYTSSELIVPNAVLVDGDNVVAVALHQQNTTSSDTTFDLMLLGQPASVVSTRPPVDFSYAGGSLVITWPDSFTGFTLKEATNLTATTVWQDSTLTPVAGGGKFTVTVPTTGPRKFFELSK